MFICYVTSQYSAVLGWSTHSILLCDGHGSLAQWKAVEGGLLDWRDCAVEGDCCSGVTGAVDAGQLEWCE